MKTLTALATLFLSLAQIQSLLSPNCDIPDDHSSTLQIMHATHPCSRKTPLSLLQMQSNDKTRLQFLWRQSILPVAADSQSPGSPYIVRARIGNPAQTLLMGMDTANDAAWVPCTGCLGCGSVAFFDYTLSSTFREVPCGASQCDQVPNPGCGGSTCGFNMSYAGSNFTAYLVHDTLSLATDPIPGYTFGCIHDASGTSLPLQGLLGLGRGPLSLLSQTPKVYQSTFSYCLPNFGSTNFSGTLKLGPQDEPFNMKCTKLLTNPTRPSLYYVQMVGIMVGRRVLDIPPEAFAFDNSTGAGTVIDSGTTFTTLVKPAYAAVRDEVRRRMGDATVSSVGGFDTCYSDPVVVRTLTFMFAGMNMTIPQENFVIRSGSDSYCLAMAESPENVNSVVNTISSFQQQNHRILIEQPFFRLCVSREPCS